MSKHVVEEVLFDEATIARRIDALAQEIRRDYGADTPIHLVAVLKGAFMFLADLMRAIGGDVTLRFHGRVELRPGTQSSGEVRLNKDLDRGLEGPRRHHRRRHRGYRA